MSFAAKLLDWLLAPLLFLWIASVGINNFAASDAVHEPFDERLDDLVRAVARQVTVEGGRYRLVLDTQASDLLHSDRKDDVWIALRERSGALIAGEGDIPLPSGPLESGVVKRHGGVVRGGEVRVSTLPIPVGEAETASELLVQVAETTSKRRELAGRLHAAMLMPQLVVVVGAGLLVWYGLHVVIAPLKRVVRAIERRSPDDLSKIPVEAMPREIEPLVVAINRLMERVRAGIAREQRFVADAAHQLRTPIAGLRNQTELALRQTEPAEMRRALQQIETSSERIARLANQLLALARAGADSAEARRERVDLNEWLPEVIERFVSRARGSGIDLGFERDDARVIVEGDPVMLGELASNLIDNALRYTPQGGVVTVRSKGGARPGFVVEDTGPGIPEEQREKVFAPFHRLHRDPGAEPLPGSGLGLSIVREIAHAHGANVAVDAGPQGRGCVFSVDFPRAGYARRQGPKTTEGVDSPMAAVR